MDFSSLNGNNIATLCVAAYCLWPPSFPFVLLPLCSPSVQLFLFLSSCSFLSFLPVTAQTSSLKACCLNYKTCLSQISLLASFYTNETSFCTINKVCSGFSLPYSTDREQWEYSVQHKNVKWVILHFFEITSFHSVSVSPVSPQFLRLLLHLFNIQAVLAFARGCFIRKFLFFIIIKSV